MLRKIWLGFYVDDSSDEADARKKRKMKVGQRKSSSIPSTNHSRRQVGHWQAVKQPLWCAAREEVKAGSEYTNSLREHLSWILSENSIGKHFCSQQPKTTVRHLPASLVMTTDLENTLVLNIQKQLSENSIGKHFRSQQPKTTVRQLPASHVMTTDLEVGRWSIHILSECCSGCGAWYESQKASKLWRIVGEFGVNRPEPFKVLYTCSRNTPTRSTENKE